MKADDRLFNTMPCLVNTAGIIYLISFGTHVGVHKKSQRNECFFHLNVYQLLGREK